MPSTYTVNLGIEQPATGEQSGTWGDTINDNSTILDEAINGVVTITLAAAGSFGSPNQIAITNGASSAGRNKWIEFADDGDLGAAAYVELIPNDAEKICFIRNSLAGSRSVFIFQGTYDAARDLEIAAGTDVLVKFSGGGSTATVINVYANLKVDGIVATTADINGGTMDSTTIGGSTAAAVTGTTIVANTSLNIAADGATVTGIKDEDNMASNSATKLATQQSIKAYVDAQVATVDTLSKVLAIGNTSGSTDIDMDNAQKVQFRDAAIYINSSVDGQLDIVADTEIQIAATTIDINGAVALNSALTTTSTIDGRDVAADGVTADAALPKAGGAMTGAITTNSTFDGRDVAADGVTADAALPKAGGTMTGDTLHGDNVVAKFGTGNDLTIHHDGSNSYITDSGTGDLIILADSLNLRNTALEYYVKCDTNAGVGVYYDNAIKLATTSTGIDVTGTVTADGLSIGSGGISTASGTLTIGLGTGNLALSDASVVPCSNLAASDSNGVVDLGSSSRRFKDLFLGGGVYLGGTGAANALDDYEEGTWTPVITSSSGSITTVGGVSGVYVKIGRTVTLNWYYQIITNGTGSGHIIISGIPFSSSSQGASSAARDRQETGETSAFSLDGASSSIIQFKYNNAYPVSDGSKWFCTLTYQIP